MKSFSNSPSKEIEERTLKIRGVSICTLQILGDGLPLLLLPSAGGRAREFEEILPRLAISFSVYSFDYPGFGASERDPSIRGIEDLTDFTKEFLDTLGTPKCHILGYSMGGWIALHLASSSPERIHKLVLVATSGHRFFHLPIQNRLTFQEILETFYYDPVARARAAHRKLSRLEKKEIYRSTQEFNHLLQQTRLQPDLTPHLRSIAHPTLVLGAEHDRAIPRPYQEALHQELPHSTLVFLKETGHALIHEKPQEASAIVLEFLRNYEKG
jgi:pimeloyl-ACP methyl ester carboxylesterase